MFESTGGALIYRPPLLDLVGSDLIMSGAIPNMGTMPWELVGRVYNVIWASGEPSGDDPDALARAAGSADRSASAQGAGLPLVPRSQHVR